MGFKPGQKCKVSGQYRALVSMVKGGRKKYAGQVTCVAGEPFPPWHQACHAVRYELSDPTRHKAKTRRP